ncbi:MAG: SDR family oxidoreductase [Chloroherpetonaceae bacterium]|nr:SDR family oxidoreductase [Chloroherpetonaceae bacterium]
MKYEGKVFVAGASGRTGLWVIKRLTHYGIPSKAFTRKKDFDAGSSLCEVSFGKIQDKDSIKRGLEGVNAVICTVGASSLFGESSPSEVDGEGIISLVNQAKEAKVKKFILVSTIAVTKPFHPLNLFGGVLNQKLRSENHLRQEYSEEDFSYTIIRPGGLKDGPPLSYALKVDTGDKIMGMVDRSDVAELCVLSLESPFAHRKTFEVIRTELKIQTDLNACLSDLEHLT